MCENFVPKRQKSIFELIDLSHQHFEKIYLLYISTKSLNKLKLKKYNSILTYFTESV